MKTWINRAIEYLKHSLEPIPQEINEIDWKEKLSQIIKNYVGIFLHLPIIQEVVF